MKSRYRKARQPKTPQSIMTQNHHSSEAVEASIPLPNDLDILCGSGKAVSAHQGNQRFQAIVNKNYASYAAALSKRRKIEVTKDVMGEIMSSGCTRFLKKHPIYEMCYVAPSRVGKDKLLHCLREMKMARARQDRRRQSPLRGDQGNSGNSSSKVTHSNEEPNFQDFSVGNYSTIQQPSMEYVLRSGLNMTMLVPETIASHAHILCPTTDTLRFGTNLSGTTSDATVLAQAAVSRASIPFEAVSQRWLTTSQQGPPEEEPLHNMEQYILATSLVDPVQEIFSSLFPEQEHQQVVQHDLSFKMMHCMFSDNNHEDI
jgi:hypothetical protein